MTRKQRIEASINDMMNFGETFIGTYEIQQDKVIKYYKALNKEVEKRLAGAVVAWDIETGMAWLV